MNLGQDRVGLSSQSSCLQCKLTALCQELKKMVFHRYYSNKREKEKKGNKKRRKVSIIKRALHEKMRL